MRIDIIADTVCPWCYIGKRRLERALETAPDLRPEIRWRVFQLNPDMPEQGTPRAGYLLHKFGSPERVSELLGYLEDCGRSLGIRFDFARIARVPNSLHSHRFIRWAALEGRQDKAIETVFRFYFEQGRDIGHVEVLCEAAEEIGLNAADARRFLASGDEREEAAREDEEFKRLGIQGVPCFVFEGKYALSGAQAPEAFAPVFDLVRNARG